MTRRRSACSLAAACLLLVFVTACGASSPVVEVISPVPSPTVILSSSPSDGGPNPSVTRTPNGVVRTPNLDDCYLGFDEDLPSMEVRGEPYVTEDQATDAWKQMTCYSAVVWAPTFLSGEMFTPEQALAIVSPYMTANAITKFTPQYQAYYDFMKKGEKLDKEGNLGEWIFNGNEEALRDFGQASAFIQPQFAALGEPKVEDFRYRNPGWAEVSGDKDIPRVNIYVEHILKTPTSFDQDRGFRWIGNYTLVPNPETEPDFAAWLIDDYTAVLQTVSWAETANEIIGRTS